MISLSFTNAFPANIPKLTFLPKIEVVSVCGYILKYVSYGDIIDYENHRNIYDAVKCELTKIIEWYEVAKEIIGQGS